MAGGGVEDVYGEDRATEEQLITPWAFSVARSHRFGSIPMLTISSSSTSLSLGSRPRASPAYANQTFLSTLRESCLFFCRLRPNIFDSSPFATVLHIFFISYYYSYGIQ